MRRTLADSLCDIRQKQIEECATVTAPQPMVLTGHDGRKRTHREEREAREAQYTRATRAQRRKVLQEDYIAISTSDEH